MTEAVRLSLVGSRMRRALAFTPAVPVRLTADYLPRSERRQLGGPSGHGQ